VRDVSFRVDARPLVYLRSAFHDVQAMRNPITLGDLDARKMIWSGFS
jgi:flavin reductase (NADH)/cob(II)yrinic acid a,c-diamide reductase